jgi:hypothetical protein
MENRKSAEGGWKLTNWLVAIRDPTFTKFVIIPPLRSAIEDIPHIESPVGQVPPLILIVRPGADVGVGVGVGGMGVAVGPGVDVGPPGADVGLEGIVGRVTPVGITANWVILALELDTP